MSPDSQYVLTSQETEDVLLEFSFLIYHLAVSLTLLFQDVIKKYTDRLSFLHLKDHPHIFKSTKCLPFQQVTFDNIFPSSYMRHCYESSIINMSEPQCHLIGLSCHQQSTFCVKVIHLQQVADRSCSSLFLISNNIRNIYFFLLLTKVSEHGINVNLLLRCKTLINNHKCRILLTYSAKQYEKARLK